TNTKNPDSQGLHRNPEPLSQFVTMIDLRLLLFSVVSKDQLSFLAVELSQTRLQAFFDVCRFFRGLDCLLRRQVNVVQRNLGFDFFEIFFDEVIRHRTEIESWIALVRLPYFVHLLCNSIERFISHSLRIRTSAPHE